MRRAWLALGLFLHGLFAGAQGPSDPAELWRHVAIYRDEWGVPHVFADSLRALAFGFGYAQAEDHIASMMTAYRVAMGRAAEILGEPYAASDEFAILMGHGDLAMAMYPNLDPITRDLCEGFALGVNAWLLDWPGRAPDWAEGVKPEEIVALMHCYLMSFAPFDLADAYHRPPGTPSGNAWALGPPRSKTGEPILVINPHADYAGPFQWCEAHLVAPGLNVSGATLFGLPVILQGHNGVLGWAITPNEPDFADVYIEKEPRLRTDPKVIGQPGIQDRLRAYLLSRMQPRVYYVKGPKGLERRRVNRLDTARGPVIARRQGDFYSYCVGGYRSLGALRQFFEMGAARDWPSFRDALAAQQIPCFHIVYADRAGNIAYVYNATTGIRPYVQPGVQETDATKQPSFEITTWDRPLPGDTLRYAWGEVLPFNALPSVVNPECGFVQACGAPPWGASFAPALARDRWPPWLAQDRDSYRSRRVRHLLSMGPRTFTDSQSMVYDVLVPFAVSSVPKLLEFADQQKTWMDSSHPDVRSALDLLRNWSYVAEANSPAMTFFHVWWSSYRALTPGFTNETDRYDAFSAGQQNPQLALEAAAQAARLLRNEYRSISVPWGTVHRVSRGNREESIAGGSTGDPLFFVSDATFQNGSWTMTGGFGFAMVVKFGQHTEAVSMLPFGVSEDPASPHFSDQLDLMIGRRFKVTRFKTEQVQRYASKAVGRYIELRPQGIEGLFRFRSREPVAARLKADLDPPSDIPRDKATYSVFVQAEHMPAEAAVALDIELQVPLEVFPQERFPELAIYAFQPNAGWYPVHRQSGNPPARVLSAVGVSPAWYAVLGPRIPEVESEPNGAAAAQARGASSSMGSANGDTTSADTENTARDQEQVDDVEGPETQAPFIPGAPAAPLVVKRPYEAASPSQAGRGAAAWGRRIELHPVNIEGYLTITFDQSAGARLHVVQDPPAPLPEGLVAFTRFVTVECSISDLEGECALTLGTDRGPPNAEGFASLRIYGWSPSQGWMELADQKGDPERCTVSAHGPLLHTYAVLGPEACYAEKDPSE